MPRAKTPAETTEAVRVLWLVGMSASDIAHHLNLRGADGDISRNIAAGIIHREKKGWGPRPKKPRPGIRPGQPRNEKKKPDPVPETAPADTIAKGMAAGAAPRAGAKPRAPRPARKAAVARPLARSAPVKRPRSGKWGPGASHALSPPPMPPAEPVTLAPIEPPRALVVPGRPVALVDRLLTQCAFPLFGAERRLPVSEYLVCGSPVRKIGQPYCEAHYHLCWHPPVTKPRKEPA